MYEMPLSLVHTRRCPQNLFLMPAHDCPVGKVLTTLCPASHIDVYLTVDGHPQAQADAGGIPVPVQTLGSDVSWNFKLNIEVNGFNWKCMKSKLFWSDRPWWKQFACQS